jgi:UDP-GlcNAc:undecaprenyl-phosphate GlcNAc-1-phosphate transferase
LAVLALQHTALAINIIDGSLPDRIAFTSIYLSGCLAGFLAFNLQRSSKRKIFLGDSGAMFLGLVVSVLTIVSFGQSGSGMSVSTSNYPALALWVLAVPLADILTTSITRILSGKNPMAPDRTHIHHRLIDAGLSKLQALTALVFAAVVYFWIGFLVTINLGNTASVILFGLAILSVLRLPATSAYLLALAKRA